MEQTGIQSNFHGDERRNRKELFADGLAWDIAQQEKVPVYDENGSQTGTEAKFDNSKYSLVGELSDLEEACGIMPGVNRLCA